jgi:geranylgeranyl reductase family protein
MKNNYDVAIIGGGPIGAFLASKIASKGNNVSIFEKKNIIGEPINCAGLVTPRVFEICKIDKEKIIENRITGAVIHSPKNNKIRIGGDKTHAFVINRKKFDQTLIEKSLENGVELNLKNKLISARKINGNIEFKISNNKKFKCNLLIGADGPNSTVRRIFSFKEPKEYLIGIGGEIEKSNLNPNYVHIFVGNKIAPGFFAWIIPTNKKGDKARIGLCINNNTKKTVKYYFNNFVKHKFTTKYLEDIKINKITGGNIPIGPLNKLYTSNVMIVGDAASQVKPTSGGGIYTGLKCADYCSKIALESINKNDFSKETLKKYQKLYQKKIGKEIDKGMIFRRIFKNLNDNQIDKYIIKFNNEKIVEIISKYGDIDYPSKLVPKLIKKSPSLILNIKNFLGNFIYFDEGGGGI